MINDPFELMQHVAQSNPDWLCVVENGRHYTYTELLQRANEYGVFFQECDSRSLDGSDLSGVNTQPLRVAIRLERGFEAYAAMFGALLVGATYCPINLEVNDQKEKTILEYFSPHIIISDAKHAFSSASNYEVVTPLSVELGSASTRIKRNYKGSDVAYVIFTSGSTGDPKGVQISRAALGSYLRWVGERFHHKEQFRWSQHPNIGFDLSVLDIYGALCFGATLYPLITPFERMFPARFIRHHQIQVWNSTPSVLDLMIASGECESRSLSSLELINCCGEPLYRKTVEALFRHAPSLEIQNTYGPTEATVSCTAITLTVSNFDALCKQTAPIGAAINGMGLYLAPYTSDDADSDIYEVFLYGAQLSSGYLKRDDLNADKFSRKYVNSEPVVCYKTGDLVKLESSHVYYHARNDALIKVKGHLVDLSKVEETVSKYTERQCCAFGVGKELVVVIASEHEFDKKSIVEYMLKFHDTYELPDRLVHLPTFPTSENDKIDRKAIMAGAVV